MQAHNDSRLCAYVINSYLFPTAVSFVGLTSTYLNCTFPSGYPIQLIRTLPATLILRCVIIPAFLCTSLCRLSIAVTWIVTRCCSTSTSRTAASKISKTMRLAAWRYSKRSFSTTIACARYQSACPPHWCISSCSTTKSWICKRQSSKDSIICKRSISRAINCSICQRCRCPNC